MTQPIVPLNGITTTHDDDFFHKRFNAPKQITVIACVLAMIFYVTSQPILCIICGLFGMFAVHNVIAKRRLRQRLHYIINTSLPPQLWQSESLRNQTFTPDKKQLIESGLQDFFILHLLYPKKPLAMPSQLIDKLWHAFILDTAQYQHYCQTAFGKMFHHVPDYSFSDRGNNIRLFTWQVACRIQAIRPARPHSMPRLFGIDPLLVTDMAIGSMSWQAHQQQMGMIYQAWLSPTFSTTSGDVGIDGDYGTYDDSCDVGMTSDGDCGCGGADSGGE